MTVNPFWINSLQVGKSENQVRLQLLNLVNLGAGECRNPRFGTRLLGTNRVPRDTRYSVFLTQKIESFRGFVRQADNAARKTAQVINAEFFRQCLCHHSQPCYGTPVGGNQATE